jgi:MoaA/NifB/PqqE/SkfB family radical SAM enzyme
VTIEGGGEPTISPMFAEAARAAMEAGLAAGLITNGASLSSGSIDQSVLATLQWVRVSLDACDRESFKALKGADRFDEVMAGLSLLSKLNPRPVLGAGYVLTRLNDDREALSRLAGRLADLGFDYLHIRPVVDHPSLSADGDLSSLAALSRPGFQLNLGALADNESGGNLGLPCLSHSLSSVITADGRVWLCGRLNVDPAAGAIGDLLESSFNDIWLGPARAAQAKRTADGRWCRQSCPQCRMTKYNRLLSRLSKIRTRDFI